MAVGSTVLVVEGALLGVGEHRVGLVDLLKALLGTGVVGVPVRVVLGGELAEGGLDLVRSRRPRHAEDPVVVPVGAQP